MTDARPYTYLIHCIPTGQVYYGVRWRNKVPAKDDLWKIYFTSSKLIKALRKQHGDDCFFVEIRREFNSPAMALEWEHKVLTRMKVLTHPMKWLNRNISSRKFLREGTISNATREKMSIAKKKRVITDEMRENISKSKLGTVPHNKGKTGEFRHSADTRAKIGETLRGRVISEETGKKISAAKKGKESRLKGRKIGPMSNITKDKLRKHRTGMKFYNNGKINVIRLEKPDGEEWVQGKFIKHNHPKNHASGPSTHQL